MVDHIGAIDRIRRVKQNFGGAAVAAQHRKVDAQGAGLLVDHDEILIEDGGKDDLGIGFLDLGQLRGEIGVAAGVGFLSHDRAALFSEDLDEVVLQALGVVIVDIVQDGRLGELQLVIDETAGDLALLRIQEADAEVVFLQLAVLNGDLLIGGNGGHVGDLVLIQDRLDGDALAGRVRADDRTDLILCAETLGYVHSFLRVALGVIADEFDLLAEDAARGVLFLDEHFQRLAFAGAIGSLVAGQGSHPAELDGIVFLSAGGKNTQHHQTGQSESNEFDCFPHKKTSFCFCCLSLLLSEGYRLVSPMHSVISLE